MNSRRALALALSVALGSTASAQIVIDGTKDAAYGPGLVWQTTPTGFGDSNLGQTGAANGSELDTVYAMRTPTTLYLLFAGNLESNFNKLEIFLDTRLGGQNRLRGDNPNVDFNGLNRMGDDGSGNGMTFDAGFASDYWIGVTGGGAPYQLFANFAETNTSGGGIGRYLGQGADVTNGLLTGGDNPDGIFVTINNSNVAGVTGTTIDGAADVLTGVEIAVPLAVLDAAGDSPMFVTAMINGGGHDFVSNQVLNTLPFGASNLGEPRGIDFSTIPGGQYFQVPDAVPEPASMVTLALGALALMRRRK
ncbi:MAG: PEP-CTERM sorting domain-containing protein [Fimbriimonadaceae bacterium]|nr:PEP-CTERM sorting domain-containing protein [Fimbriimonadaceae bacterium]